MKTTSTHTTDYWTLTLTSDINGGIDNIYTGRLKGDVLKTHLKPRNGNFVWLTGNHNETSGVPVEGHILERHTKTVTTTRGSYKILTTF